MKSFRPLQPPESHSLSAASGWLGLGRPIEAGEELQSLSAENKVHPDVLEVRWQIAAKTGNWRECLDLAEALIILIPTRTSGWINRSRAFHELKRTPEAVENLRSVAQQFSTQWTISYDLACYCAQLGRLEDCKIWLRKAVAADKEAATRAAIADPSLKPLWIAMMAKNPKLVAKTGAGAHSASKATLPQR